MTYANPAPFVKLPSIEQCKVSINYHYEVEVSNAIKSSLVIKV